MFVPTVLKFESMLASLKRLIPEQIKIAYHFLQALAGAAIFLFPSLKLKVIGVTGTDGKTTTVHLIYHILSETGEKVSMISTVQAKIRQKNIDTGFHVTTPDPIKVQQLLRKMLNAKSEYAILEATSHGLAQERVAFVKFFASAITNITHEHLDYHKTYEHYLNSKAKILNGVKLRVLNVDDKSFDKLKLRGGGQLVSYGIKNKADFKARDIEQSIEGLTFEIHFTDKREAKKIKIKSSILGEYNVYNILAAFALTFNLGVEPEAIASSIATFRGIEGRMQYINIGQDFDTVVDFAHTPEGLRSALKTLKTVKKGRLISVFGCAGERDVGKRRLMGEIAAELSDLSIFTAEDPRSEGVNKIIDEIEAGALKESGVPEVTFWKVPDRKEAIYKAIVEFAKKDDTVAIFGKGHEKSMNIGGVEYPWSDENVAREALKERLKVQ